VNGLSLLVLVALAIGIVVAYRVGIARGARDARAHGVGPMAALTADRAPAPAMSDPPAPAPAVPAPTTPAATATPPPASTAEVDQALALAAERPALFRALADARGETARYRQLVIDLENDAPPPLLDGPGAPDDLKLIVGIGPVLERMLQQLGISRYRQIARWSERDIDEFDARLAEFPGRIRRDTWVTQARSLHQSKYGEALPPRDRA
jgi:predicted flap endonuclease-1-like 5' DNA nuclease